MGTLRFAIFCNGDLEMGGLDSIRFVNAVDGGLLGQLRVGKLPSSQWPKTWRDVWTPCAVIRQEEVSVSSVRSFDSFWTLFTDLEAVAEVCDCGF